MHAFVPLLACASCAPEDLMGPLVAGTLGASGWASWRLARWSYARLRRGSASTAQAPGGVARGGSR